MWFGISGLLCYPGEWSSALVPDCGGFVPGLLGYLLSLQSWGALCCIAADFCLHIWWVWLCVFILTTIVKQSSSHRSSLLPIIWWLLSCSSTLTTIVGAPAWCEMLSLFVASHQCDWKSTSILLDLALLLLLLVCTVHGLFLSTEACSPFAASHLCWARSAQAFWSLFLFLASRLCWARSKQSFWSFLSCCCFSFVLSKIQSFSREGICFQSFNYSLPTIHTFILNLLSVSVGGDVELSSSFLPHSHRKANDLMYCDSAHRHSKITLGRKSSVHSNRSLAQA